MANPPCVNKSEAHPSNPEEQPCANLSSLTFEGQQLNREKQMQTLSERIATRIQNLPKATTASRNRSTFIALRPEIQQAYSDGWSLLAIWKLLHEEQRIPFTYQAFRRYAHQLIDKPAFAQKGIPLLQHKVEAVQKQTNANQSFSYNQNQSKSLLS